VHRVAPADEAARAAPLAPDAITAPAPLSRGGLRDVRQYEPVTDRRPGWVDPLSRPIGSPGVAELAPPPTAPAFGPAAVTSAQYAAVAVMLELAQLPQLEPQDTVLIAARATDAGAVAWADLAKGLLVLLEAVMMWLLRQAMRDIRFLREARIKDRAAYLALRQHQAQLDAHVFGREPPPEWTPEMRAYYGRRRGEGLALGTPRDSEAVPEIPGQDGA
jgi:hypothetical protein